LTISDNEMHTRLLVASAIAREAGGIAHRRFLDRESFSVGLKGPQDFITEVDGETERYIHSRLIEIFPGDGFIGEEGAMTAPAAGHPIWVVDPIDGTANFTRGVPHYCVSIACVSGTEIDVGVIFDPSLNELFAARRGQGALLNGAPIEVTGATSLKNASVEVGWNARLGGSVFIGLVERVVATGAGVSRTGSGALALAYVAAGRSDGYVEQHINSWDCLAGILLVTEAGGRASDFLAGEGLRKGNPLLVGSPGVFDALARAAAIDGLVA
jgi:myo-inositol-1(or 4)-monophosphatase